VGYLTASLGVQVTTSVEYVAILRCQTWNVWPERCVAEDRTFIVDDGTDTPLHARLAILAYEQRSTPEQFNKEVTSIGPLIWDGEMRGFHRVRDTILKAPEDEILLEWQHRNSHRGELDICIDFKYAGEIPTALVEALRATTSAVVSLVNLALHDFLVPAAPFQLRRVLPDGGGQIEASLLLAVHNRRTLSQSDLQATVSHVTHALKSSVFGPKLVTALELYAAHFTEQQARVRFLLLVVAMESLSSPSEKHDAAIALLRRWEVELKEEMTIHTPSSEAWLSLDALRRELGFRSEDSIRSQIRKLFAALPGIPIEEAANLQRRALRVYDKRSTLVHDGQLPAGDLIELEREARELLETIFAATIESPRNATVAVVEGET
jgi:hypothetical protein